ncbi:MAG: hypothetical protein HKM98_01775 [Gammaproteobacteria bacterium]|nr:hypothetical protein [Woeseia sp.]NNF66215.1 hypothetical protein [Gammaproteobacteria bacterium]
MNLRKLLGKEATGTAIGVLIVSWFAFESYVLAGEEVRNVGFHAVGAPLTFEVPVAGETFGIAIDRGNMRGSGRSRATRGGGDKRLKWQILDPGGQVVLADNDSYARGSRLVKFTPQSAGTHTLLVEWDNSGFFKRHGAGYITLLVNRNDRTLLRRWFPFIW